MSGSPESSKPLIEALRKISLFRGLSPTQVRQMLGVCARKSYQPGDKVCTSNMPSDEMYILLSGELEVVTTEGIQVATLVPVTTVGEMGMITRQLHSATVKATQPSQLLAIPRSPFEYLFRDDAEMQAKVYRNIADILVAKLLNDNVRTRDHQMAKRSYEDRLAALERQMEIALDLLAQQGLPRPTAQQQIAAKVNGS
jgi:CRP-like cAMP-binding protein